METPEKSYNAHQWKPPTHTPRKQYRIETPNRYKNPEKPPYTIPTRNYHFTQQTTLETSCVPHAENRPRRKHPSKTQHETQKKRHAKGKDPTTHLIKKLLFWTIPFRDFLFLISLRFSRPFRAQFPKSKGQLLFPQHGKVGAPL